MKRDTSLQKGDIKIVISGPLKLVIGREISIPYHEDITIQEVIQHLTKLYEERTGKGHNKFDDLMKQLVIYIGGRKWDKKTVLKLDRNTRVDIVHIINGG